MADIRKNVYKKRGSCGKNDIYNDLLSPDFVIMSDAESIEMAKTSIAAGDRIYTRSAIFTKFSKNKLEQTRNISLSAIRDEVIPEFKAFVGNDQKYQMVTLNQRRNQIPYVVKVLRQLASGRDIYVRHCLYTGQSDYFIQNNIGKQGGASKADKLNNYKDGTNIYRIDDIVKRLDDPVYVDMELGAAAHMRIQKAKDRRKRIIAKLSENPRLKQAIDGLMELCWLYFELGGVSSLTFNEFKSVSYVESISPVRHVQAKKEDGKTDDIAVYPKLNITPEFLKENKDKLVEHIKKAHYSNNLFDITNERKCVSYSYNLTVTDSDKCNHSVLFLDDIPLSLKDSLPSNFYLIETSPGNCQCHVFLDKPLSSAERAVAIEKLKAIYKTDVGAYDNQGRRTPGFLNRKPEYLSVCGYQTPTSKTGYSYTRHDAHTLLHIISAAGFGLSKRLNVADIQNMQVPSARSVKSVSVSRGNNCGAGGKINAKPRQKEKNNIRSNKNYDSYVGRNAGVIKNLLPPPSSVQIASIYQDKKSLETTIMGAHFAFAKYMAIYDLSEAEIVSYLRSNHDANSEPLGKYNGAGLDKYYDDTVRRALAKLHIDDPGHPRFRS